MKKNQKISLIVLPILILVSLFLISLPFDNHFSSSPKNNSDQVSSESFNDIFSSLSVPIIGSANAPVTIIAFNDYQCKDCKTWYDNEYSKISKELIDTQKANMVFLDSTPLGTDSILISEATYCANEQEKYSEYQEILFNSQQEIDAWAKSEQLKIFAVDLELDLKSFEECLDSETFKDDVLSNIEFAKSYGIDRIPVFKIVNFEGREHVLKGSLPSMIFEDVVNRFQ